MLERDAESSYLAGAAVEAGPMDQLLGHSITYRYQLKTPYRDGTTYVIFEPLDFIARPGAQAPGQPDAL